MAQMKAFEHQNEEYYLNSQLGVPLQKSFETEDVPTDQK